MDQKSLNYICIDWVQYIHHSYNQHKPVYIGIRLWHIHLYLVIKKESEYKIKIMNNRQEIFNFSKCSITTTFKNDTIFHKRLLFFDCPKFDLIFHTSWRNSQTPFTHLLLIWLVFRCNNFDRISIITKIRLSMSFSLFKPH